MSPSSTPAPFPTTALNLPKWLSQNSHLLQPPINNHCVYAPSSPYTSGQTVMIVGGPNSRTDYHINSTPEFFYQHKGSMVLKMVIESDESDGPEFIDVPIHEGSLFLLPAHIPHNPVRFAETVGIVLEVPRGENEEDRLRWYCRSGKAGCEGFVVHEKSFRCVDLGTQVKAAVEAFAHDLEARTCGRCGELVEVRPGVVEQPSRFPPRDE